jgi:molybdopterin synthase catalytic subunit
VTVDAAPARVRLAAISEMPLSVVAVQDAVADDQAGATAVFVGMVRDHDHGRSVAALTYEAHPSAAAEIARVAAEVAAQPGVLAVAAVHRVGPLAIGDLAVVVAVSCGHRGDAFAATRELIDRVKAEVPIWKHQTFTDGSSEWVACAVDADPLPAAVGDAARPEAAGPGPAGRTLQG